MMAENGKAFTGAVTAIGMTTPVGHTAYQSCASIRAGLTRMSELPGFHVENDWFEATPVVGCRVEEITDGTLGLGRWTRLAMSALGDLLRNAGLSAAELGWPGVYFAMPPPGRAGVDRRIEADLGPRIAEWTRVPDLASRTRVYCDGHAAGARACADALNDLETGHVDRAIVCGVDSLVEPETLSFFAEKGRLKTEDNVDGFVPGEAAAGFLVEDSRRTKERGAEVLATLEAACVASEDVTIWAGEACPATGLSEAVRGTLDKLTDHGDRTALLICDLNGESYRAREFGNMVPRVLSSLNVEWDLWHPADCIGDTGAASLVVSACVGARALEKGYARSEGVLVFGSSDDGLRGSLYLRKAS